MRRKLALFLSLGLILSTQAGCPTEPSADSDPESSLEERLKAAGFTSVVETEQTGSVTSRILMTEDQTRGAIIVTEAESSVIFGLDESDPEVVFQLLTPDGEPFISVFEDKVILADGSEMPLSGDNGSGNPSNGGGDGEGCAADSDCDGVADEFDNCPVDANPDQQDINANGIGDACDPSAKSGTRLQAVECFAGAMIDPILDALGVSSTNAGNIGLNTGSPFLKETLAGFGDTLVKAVGIVKAAEQVLAAYVDCVCDPIATVDPDGVCVEAGGDDSEIDVVATMKVSGGICGSIAYFPTIVDTAGWTRDTVAGPTNLSPLPGSIKLGPGDGDIIERVLGGIFTYSERLKPTEAGEYTVEYTFTPAYGAGTLGSGSNFTAKLRVTALRCEAPAIYSDSVCGCDCPDGTEVVSLGGNVFGCKCNTDCDDEPDPPIVTPPDSQCANLGNPRDVLVFVGDRADLATCVSLDLSWLETPPPGYEFSIGSGTCMIAGTITNNCSTSIRWGGIELCGGESITRTPELAVGTNNTPGFFLVAPTSSNDVSINECLFGECCPS